MLYLLSFPALFSFRVRSCLSWHYPNSPKNGKPALSPHHDWLKTGSQRQNAPLCIWFYPQ
ncbi:serine/threonine protein kinase [Escherichia coli]|uniref:serine/threonine protein kinase n=1 Tax=Enterobacteriaceae TaxID=543 RepID=UPI00094389CF|nr:MULTISPECIES: serine/threonine protein kinase [Enterobacteriaceae]EHK3794366.1 serine/threonine protein kinase [Escherichia coli]EIP7879188.1 serine/threonine protein kinase [Escherichia coli]EIT7690082.1 serine/threonine protein kinase [Escherichia coli]EJT9392891.1 serine/threonine protein kinase [Escherichia coli]EKE9077787.1 serine/threonine protein kinase [Escherichia coli]